MLSQQLLAPLRKYLRAIVEEFPLCYGYWSKWAAYERKLSKPRARHRLRSAAPLNSFRTRQ